MLKVCASARSLEVVIHYLTDDVEVTCDLQVWQNQTRLRNYSYASKRCYQTDHRILPLYSMVFSLQRDFKIGIASYLATEL
jgi:hypothetical protein